MPSQDRFNDLLERLDADGEVAGALELDTLTTLRDIGFDDLIETAEQERDRIGELGERGIPELAIAPVLVLAGAPDDVVEQATSDVEAHLLGKKPATLAAMGAILGTLAFAQQATAAQPQATTQTNPAAQAQVTPAAQAQVSPAALAQISPAAQAQIQPAATAQVKPAAKAQVCPAAPAQVAKAQRKRRQGVQANRLTAQTFSLLRARGL